MRFKWKYFAACSVFNRNDNRNAKHHQWWSNERETAKAREKNCLNFTFFLLRCEKCPLRTEKIFMVIKTFSSWCWLFFLLWPIDDAYLSSALLFCFNFFHTDIHWEKQIFRLHLKRGTTRNLTSFHQSSRVHTSAHPCKILALLLMLRRQVYIKKDRNVRFEFENYIERAGKKRWEMERGQRWEEKKKKR